MFYPIYSIHAGNYFFGFGFILE